MKHHIAAVSLILLLGTLVAGCSDDSESSLASAPPITTTGKATVTVTASQSLLASLQTMVVGIRVESADDEWMTRAKELHPPFATSQDVQFTGLTPGTASVTVLTTSASSSLGLGIDGASGSVVVGRTTHFDVAVNPLKLGK